MCEVRAHPRACGENRTIVAWRLPAAGSSPRVRGKRAVSRGRAWHRGLIPARAGKTAALGSVCGFAWAHPRACGENFVIRATFPGPWGSSPRVRGKPRSIPPRERGLRLIPARAGKTSRAARPGTGSPAHPRACGENRLIHWPTRTRVGSSPRVRGKRHGDEPRQRCQGLIPARAGKTFRGEKEAGGGAAHPRACGENAPGRGAHASVSGSSPRVRGKLDRTPVGTPAPGLIPARAGKTFFSFTLSFIGTAHPRACGENSATSWAAA